MLLYQLSINLLLVLLKFGLLFIIDIFYQIFENV